MLTIENIKIVYPNKDILMEVTDNSIIDSQNKLLLEIENNPNQSTILQIKTDSLLEPQNKLISDVLTVENHLNSNTSVQIKDDSSVGLQNISINMVKPIKLNIFESENEYQKLNSHIEVSELKINTVKSENSINNMNKFDTAYDSEEESDELPSGCGVNGGKTIDSKDKNEEISDIQIRDDIEKRIKIAERKMIRCREKEQNKSKIENIEYVEPYYIKLQMMDIEILREQIKK
jgi:hypothetical protein